MSLSDKAKRAVRQAAGTARRGAANAKDTAKQQVLKREERATAARIGELVYRSRQGEAGLEDEIDQLISELDDLRAHRTQDDA